MTFRLFWAGLAAITTIGLTQPATAQEAGSFALELNNAEDNNAGGCRVTYVARNNAEEALSNAQYEVAIFDGENVVKKLLSLRFGAFGGGDTKVSQFDISDLTCDNISSVVINRVVACTKAGSNDTSDVCKDGLDASSLTAIRFYD